mmetsp:Transcript_72184/g.233533  ORF Transcript_72184/g.233533 Transcript_72184/m.233533 type:complete len:278 (-) Transcript_72184:215-1048(-)
MHQSEAGLRPAPGGPHAKVRLPQPSKAVGFKQVVIAAARRLPADVRGHAHGDACVVLAGPRASASDSQHLLGLQRGRELPACERWHGAQQQQQWQQRARRDRARRRRGGRLAGAAYEGGPHVQTLPSLHRAPAEPPGLGHRLGAGPHRLSPVDGLARRASLIARACRGGRCGRQQPMPPAGRMGEPTTWPAGKPSAGAQGQSVVGPLRQEPCARTTLRRGRCKACRARGCPWWHPRQQRALQVAVLGGDVHTCAHGGAAVALPAAFLPLLPGQRAPQ